jgi:hypothetical protein
VRTRIIGWLLAASAATFGYQIDRQSKASIEGQVVNQATGAPLQNATVNLLWRQPGVSHNPLVQKTNEEGRFRFMMAWDDVGRDDLENPDFVKRFESQGTPVKLSASGSATVSIKVISQEIAR